jgi:hypothetical protein
LARSFEERRARARRQMKWIAVLGVLFFGALAIDLAYEFASGERIWTAASKESPLGLFAGALFFGSFAMGGVSILALSPYIDDPTTAPTALRFGHLFVCVLVILALGTSCAIEAFEAFRRGTGFPIFYFLGAISLGPAGVLGLAIAILMLFFGRRTIRIDQPPLAITREAIGPFAWRDVVRVKAIGSETAPRLFVMLKDAPKSSIKTSPLIWPYRRLFKHDPLKAKLFDVELCRVSAAYPSRIGLLDALHRAMPPRIELET